MKIPADKTRNHWRKIIGGTLGAACALVLAGCPLLNAQSPVAVGRLSEVTAAMSRAASPLAFPDYVISPDDVLLINVYDSPEITGEYRVSPTGKIDLPLLSAPIVAAGKTPGQLADLIGVTYHESQIVTHARVTVAIKESRVHAISVSGAVRRPQLYPVFGKTTLLDVLSQAEGLADDAGSMAVVTRGSIAMQVITPSEGLGPGSKAESTFSVDIGRLTDTGDPLLNVELYPGDRVTVQRAGVIYVVGAVNRPGGFPLKSGQQDMTVVQAVALAEDLKPIAARRRALIIRRNSVTSNGREEIPVNLSNVLAGRDRDTRLQANDILFVPESPGEKALHRGTEAAISAATWGLIYRW